MRSKRTRNSSRTRKFVTLKIFKKKIYAKNNGHRRIYNIFYVHKNSNNNECAVTLKLYLAQNINNYYYMCYYLSILECFYDNMFH